jgi:putative flippase GtrA
MRCVFNSWIIAMIDEYCLNKKTTFNDLMEILVKKYCNEGVYEIPCLNPPDVTEVG